MEEGEIRKSPINKALLAFKQKKKDSIFVSKIEFLYGGAEGIRTPDLIRARDALSQLSHGPIDVNYMDFGAIVKAPSRGRSTGSWFWVDIGNLGTTIC